MEDLPKFSGGVSKKFMPNSSSSSCQLCAKGFGFTRKRHHCKRCGFLICEECSLKRGVRIEDKEVVRICDYCSVELLDDQKSHEDFVKQLSVRDAHLLLPNTQETTNLSLTLVPNGRCHLSGSLQESSKESVMLKSVGFLRRQQSSGRYYLRYLLSSHRSTLELYLSSISNGLITMEADSSDNPSKVCCEVSLSIIDSLGLVEEFTLVFPSYTITASASFRIPKRLSDC